MAEILERLKTLKVQDVMSSDAIEVHLGESLVASAATMAKRHVSGLPVVDDDRRCVGMLTAFDFVLPFSAESDPRRGAGRNKLAADVALKVAERMTSRVQSVSRDVSLLEAARKMCDEHIHRLPVLDGSGRVEGMVTSLDVVAALANAADEESNSPNYPRTRRGER